LNVSISIFIYIIPTTRITGQLNAQTTLIHQSFSPRLTGTCEFSGSTKLIHPFDNKPTIFVFKDAAQNENEIYEWPDTKESSER